jgi:hypothetical protein
MRIVLPSSPERFGFPLRAIGACGRYDTVSDCEFLDDNHIVCCDRQMARLYLLRIDYAEKTMTVLDTKEFIVSGEPAHTELLCLQGSTLHTISYSDKLFSCDIVGGRFTNLRSTTVTAGEAYHGVCSAGFPNTVYVTNMRSNSITRYTTTTKAKSTMVCEGGVRMKDATLVGEDHILVLSSNRGPINTTRRPDGSISPTNPLYDSHALLYNRRTGARVATYLFKDIQVDGCVYYKNRCWVTCTDKDGKGSLWSAAITTDHRFADERVIPCADFPHGLAIRNNILAYTSYGDCSLTLHRISDEGVIIDLL